MCKCANDVLDAKMCKKTASKGDHLHILTFAHLHISQAFAHGKSYIAANLRTDLSQRGVVCAKCSASAGVCATCQMAACWLRIKFSAMARCNWARSAS